MLSELTKTEFQIIRPWINQSDLMHFAQLNGERIFGYYARHREMINALAGVLTVIYSGVELGKIMGKKLKPEHSLAVFHDVSRQVMPFTELDRENALRYLRKEDVNPNCIHRRHQPGRLRRPSARLGKTHRTPREQPLPQRVAHPECLNQT